MTAALLAICILLDVVRELCFKTGALTGAGGAPRFAAALRNPAINWPLIGGIVWAIEIVCWAGVLAKLPMTIAFPIMSFTYAATPLAGAWLLGENISPRRWLGIGLVTAGVMIVGATGIG